MADSHSDRARSVGIDMRGFRVQPNNDRISMRKRSKNRAEIHRKIHKKNIRKSPRKCQENSTEKHHKNHQKKYQKSLKKHSKNKVEKRDPKKPPRTNDLRQYRIQRRPPPPSDSLLPGLPDGPTNGNAHKRFP